MSTTIFVRKSFLALRQAQSLAPGDKVTVDAPRYHGPGVVSRATHFDSHIVWLDHEGVTVAVEVPSGNVWLYPALTVRRATDAEDATP